MHDELVGLRRELHANPELHTDLPWTANRIARALDELGISYLRLDEHCLVGTVGNGGGRSIAIRADMDALPMTEETGLSFASENGCMHACGHDGHAAMLVGAAALLKNVEDDLGGIVYLCFQSGEETGAGAGVILDHLRSVGGVDQVIAIHLWADIDSGRISVVAGPRMAGADGFQITVHGVGGHGSRPDLAIDPIKPAAAITLAISAIPANMASNLHPGVVHVGQLQGGTAPNVFPSSATVTGGARWFYPTTRASITSAIERIAGHTAAAHGARADVEFVAGVSPVVNDANAVARAERVIAEMDLQNDAFEQICASENYALFTDEYPGFMAYLGVRRPGVAQHYQHHPKYDIDEAVLPRGAEFFARYAHGFLADTRR